MIRTLEGASFAARTRCLRPTILSDPQNAAALIRQVAPAALLEAIDLSTLTFEATNTVDERLRGWISDLVYSVKTAGGHTARIAFLVEHQSTPDDLICWRLQTYTTNKGNDYLKAHPKAKRVPLMVPILLTHCIGNWPDGPKHLHDVFEPNPATIEGLSGHVPGFELLTHDISRSSDADLRRADMPDVLRAAFWLLRDARNLERLLAGLSGWAAVFSRINQDTDGLVVVSVMYRYVESVVGPVQFQRFRDKLEAEVPDLKGGTAVTITEYLKEEGRQEGRQEGHKAGQAALLLKQIKFRFGADVTLPPDLEERLAEADLQ